MSRLDLSAYKPTNNVTSDANAIDNAFTAVETAINGIDVAGNLAPSVLAGYPADASKVLRGDGSWTLASSGIYRKTTAKQVVSTVAETDLLNGEITIAANAVGASGVLRLSARGDWKNQSGVASSPPQFKLKLGATTLLDTNQLGAVAATSAARYTWRIDVLIANLGLTNSQWASLDLGIMMAGASAATAQNFLTGEGVFQLPNATASATEAFANGGNSAAVDTTTPLALVLSVINGSNSASYDIMLKHALVEIL